ncbi:MAG: glutamate synthase-related protein [Treponema sp.]|uniref:glutamate synthase-related protein n=1 Tax=Treponema sp. TaxID=166 RepID=UPI002A91A59D|nr:glutamate synthase-related protein [Treponema sp.]MDY6397227.1 glutamate synthase-related protein [Treponema sp.]
MKTLYEPQFEHDSCGIGAVVSIDGKKSHEVIENALSIVEKLEHRAGKDASGETGDGVGILAQISHAFFKEAAKNGEISLAGKKCESLGDERDYGIGMFFFPNDGATSSRCEAESEKTRFEKVCKNQNLKFLGWRRVPVNADVLGKKARDCMPEIWQGFVERPSNCEKGLEFDKLLYKARLSFEKGENGALRGVPAERVEPDGSGTAFTETRLKTRLTSFSAKADGSLGKTSPNSLSTYVCSLSSRTIVYKGMFLVGQLRTFYLDLQSPLYDSSLALVHSRFSTNTNPSWQRAHPNRFIAHNGEINTIRGNADRMLAREGEIDLTGSDSAMLDNTLEYLTMNGMDLPLSVMVCIPQAWKHEDTLSQDKKDFYHYWATMMESWDGPAAILFSDGDVLGATLDRNGLRPSRYYITSDNMLILSSEVGVLEIPESKIVKKSRLMPGKMLLVDTKAKKLITNDEIKSHYANQHPYGEWLSQNLVQLASLKIPNKKIPVSSQEERDRLYRAFGWNYEDVNEMVLQMAKTGVEPIGSMGVDTPLAAMSDNHPSLFEYFKQLFAQVTNPPIDSLREKIVTDTTVYVGSDGDLLNAKGKNCHVLEIHNPILTGTDLIKIKALDQKGLRTTTLSLLIKVKDLIDCHTDSELLRTSTEDNSNSIKGVSVGNSNPNSRKNEGGRCGNKKSPLETALDNIFSKIDSAYEQGYNIIVLSDRGVDEEHACIPSLLAVSAVEQYLIRTKKRTKISIILESAEVRNVHQAAMCLGYGARAVNPYLAHEAIAELIDQKILDKDYHTAIEDYNKAIINGIVKIAAKMGISTVQSYQSAQIFEAVGISSEVTDKYFTNTVSRVGGIGLKEIEEDIIYHHNKAWNPNGLTENSHLDSTGYHKMRRGPGAEDHLYNPETIIALQESTQKGDYKRFKEYTALVDADEHPHTLRAMLDFNFDKNGGIPIEEVEGVDEIVKRFKTGAMSYGSISEEAHKCMAEAMNHLHGKSNSGEGGEQPERLGTKWNSAIKQVASGRFGVTEEYLLSAKEIQIKMAQGAKPGEGGHLPGKKVYPWIAQTRYATPGVSLISPPPHHDIYSIEDLAQLIYDLKNANRDARISVKLVSEAGVGTVAAGVAKAGSQVILISGHDGGTGAAPISSIHNAGLPWELGLSEAHQTLIQNGLRGRVIIETDGKLMSGRDVAIAALLGAEEFGFATAPLVTMGCRMMRACQSDTCPFGIATQNEKLRANFKGKAEYVENFMRFIAEELREYMAKLGIRSVEELCGRTDLLKLKEKQGFKRANLLDLSRVLANEETENEEVENGKRKTESWKTERSLFDFELEKTLDVSKLLNGALRGVPAEGVADDASGTAFTETRLKTRLTSFSAKADGSLGETSPSKTPSYRIESTDRTACTILGSEIQKKHGSSIGEDTYKVYFTGGAGQSFGAFIPKGLSVYLEGDANDYLGKGLSGGKIVVKKAADFSGKAEENIIIGNVALFGATSGEAFINGVAGERFCVRNSGATAVVEGTGDHALEYMTGGFALILGETGRNLAAGMSGGVAYILDEKHDVYKKLNREFVTMYDLDDEVTALVEEKSSASSEDSKGANPDVKKVRSLLEKHVKETGSEKAGEILSDFENFIPRFKKIIPNDYLKVKVAGLQAE